MIYIAIVEDNPDDQELLKSYVQRIKEEDKLEFALSVFCSGEDFLKNYSPSFDIVLMDIEMPSINGIETARLMRQKDEDVSLVFVTNMSQYALKGYEVNAIDYILKPIKYPEFYIKIKKAMRFISKNKSKTIVLTTAEGTFQVATSEIYYVEVRSHYLTYHTKKGVFEVRGTMKDAETSLQPFNFVRFSNSFLANMRHIDLYKGSAIIINNESFPIGRKYKDTFLAEFSKYISSGVTK